MRPRPYIGITGFTKEQEVAEILDTLPPDWNPKRLVMVGVLASGKTIRGIPNKWPKRYPEVKDLGSVFTSDSVALNLIHFNTKNPENLVEELCLAQSLAGQHCHGFQLNIAWPDKEALATYRIKRGGETTIVLQCGGKALADVDHSPEKLREKVAEYRDLIDYVLVDPSGGLGKEFDLELARGCFSSLSQIPDIGFGIAGGLSADNIDRLEPLLAEFPNFSIDAEGRLRDENDNLNVPVSVDYLLSAGLLMQKFA